MREFFKGWRRKAGCAVLVLAVVFSIAWGRSQFVTDTFEICEYDSRSCLLVIESKSGWLKLVRLKIVRDVNESVDLVRDGGGAVSYLSMIIPLTLYSAYLIIWKARTKPKEQPDA